jgi:hypothetical protein
MRAKLRYVIRENAGYKGERDVHATDKASAAFNWIRETYAETEADTLHIAVYDRKTGEYI